MTEYFRCIRCGAFAKLTEVVDVLEYVRDGDCTCDVRFRAGSDLPLHDWRDVPMHPIEAKGGVP